MTLCSPRFVYTSTFLKRLQVFSYELKLAKSNIEKEDRTVLTSLQKDNATTILPAGKGKTTVVIETSAYNEKVRILLSDEEQILEVGEGTNTDHLNTIQAPVPHHTEQVALP